MTTDYRELMQGVMQLPKAARLQFGQEVISSVLGDEIPPGPSEAEIERRMEAFEAGEHGTSDAREAVQRLLKKFTGDANKAAR
jgi:hypothetical protein